MLVPFNNLHEKALKKVKTYEGLITRPRYFWNFHRCYHFAIVLHEIALVFSQSDARHFFHVYY